MLNSITQCSRAQCGCILHSYHPAWIPSVPRNPGAPQPPSQPATGDQPERRRPGRSTEPLGTSLVIGNQSRPRGTGVHDRFRGRGLSAPGELPNRVPPLRDRRTFVPGRRRRAEDPDRNGRHPNHAGTKAVVSDSVASLRSPASPPRLHPVGAASRAFDTVWVARGLWSRNSNGYAGSGDFATRQGRPSPTSVQNKPLCR